MSDQNRIGPPPGSPEERPGHDDEDDRRYRDTDGETDDYYRRQREMDAAQWRYDHMLPGDHR